MLTARSLRELSSRRPALVGDDLLFSTSQHVGRAMLDALVGADRPAKAWRILAYSTACRAPSGPAAHLGAQGHGGASSTRARAPSPSRPHRAARPRPRDVGAPTSQSLAGLSIVGRRSPAPLDLLQEEDETPSAPAPPVRSATQGIRGVGRSCTKSLVPRVVYLATLLHRGQLTPGGA